MERSIPPSSSEFEKILQLAESVNEEISKLKQRKTYLLLLYILGGIILCFLFIFVFYTTQKTNPSEWKLIDPVFLFASVLLVVADISLMGYSLFSSRKVSRNIKREEKIISELFELTDSLMKEIEPQLKPLELAVLRMRMSRLKF